MGESGWLVVTDDQGTAIAIRADGSFAVPGPWEIRAHAKATAGFEGSFSNVAFDAAHASLLALQDGRTLISQTMSLDAQTPSSGPAARFDVSRFGIEDPRGIAIEPLTGRLFVLDVPGSARARLLVVDPGEGASGADALARGSVSEIDLSAELGSDPRGLALDPRTGHLFTSSAAAGWLYELTPAGGIVEIFDLASVRIAEPAALAFAPAGTISGSAAEGWRLFVADQGPHPRRGERGAGQILELDLSDGSSTVPGGVGSHTGRESTPPGQRLPRERFIPLAEGVVTGGIQVTSSSDDAEQKPSGTMNLTSSDLELVHDSTDQIVGIRFNNIPVPKNAAVASAYIQFQTDEAQSVDTQLTFYGQAVDNAPTFTIVDNDITSRTKTSASVPWAPAAWNTVGEVSSLQRTPDLGSIVQEVVNRPGWSSGNSMVFIIQGIGHRTAVAFDGIPAGAPALFIQLTNGGGNQFPTVNAGSPQTITLPSGAALRGTASDDGLPGPLTTTWSKVSGPGTVSFVNPSALQTTASFGQEGTYVLRLTATDTALSSTSDVTITVQPAASGGPSGSVAVRVSASSDDAEEGSSGSVNLTSSDLELVHDSTDQVIGIRFNNITVPKAAQITRAAIQFTTDEAQSDTTHLVLFGQKVANAPTFTTSSTNISSRVQTSASATWDPVPWTTVGETGANQKTPELKAIVQEIVNQSGWASGNSMVFIIVGNGHRTAVAFDGSTSTAPLLTITYGAGTGGNLPPVVYAGADQSVSVLTANLQGSVSDDGLPTTPGQVTTTWTKVSGPGTVTFSSTSSLSPTATFSTGGTYVLRLTGTDGELSSSDDVTITAGSSSSNSQIAVYVGYYDTHHSSRTKPKPSPWKGSSNVVFVGKVDSGGGWDTAAVRVDNLSGGSLSGVVVSVDVGSDHFALWGTNTLPAGGILILAQTSGNNFDGSDTNDAGCYGCSPTLCTTKVKSTIPVVHVTVGGRTTNYSDTGQVLNTKGVDSAGCPYTGTRNDESQNWVRLN